MPASTPPSNVSSTNSTSKPREDTNGTEKREVALAKSTDYYASKSRTVHAAILEVWDGTPFLEVAKKYNQSPDVLASAFAVFGKQAIDIAREKGVVCTCLLPLPVRSGCLGPPFSLTKPYECTGDDAKDATVLRNSIPRNGLQQRRLR